MAETGVSVVENQPRVQTPEQSRAQKLKANSLFQEASLQDARTSHYLSPYQARMVIQAGLGRTQALYRLAPQFMNTVSPQENDPKPVYKIDQLTLGLLDKLQTELKVRVQVGNKIYQGSLIRVLKEVQDNPEVVREVLDQVSGEVAALRAEALNAVCEFQAENMVDAGHSEVAQRFRAYLLSLNEYREPKWQESISKFSDADCQKIFQLMVQSEPWRVENFLLQSDWFDAWQVGNALGQIRVEEIREEKQKQEIARKKREAKEARQVDLKERQNTLRQKRSQQLQNLDRALERLSVRQDERMEAAVAQHYLNKPAVERLFTDNAQKLPSIARQFFESTAAGQVYKDNFAYWVIGRAEEPQGIGRPLAIWEVGALYSMQRELGLESSSLPSPNETDPAKINEAYAKLASARERLAKMRPIVDRQILTRFQAEVFEHPALYQRLLSYLDAHPEILDQHQLQRLKELQARPGRTENTRRNLARAANKLLANEDLELEEERNTADKAAEEGIVGTIMNEHPEIMWNLFSINEQFWLGASLPAAFYTVEDQHQKTVSRKMWDYRRAETRESAFYSEILGTKENIRQEIRESVVSAIDKMSHLKKAKKIAGRALGRLLFNPEGESIFHLPTPGETAKQKLLYNLLYAAPGVASAAALAIINWASEGTVNHEMLHSTLPLINGGLIAGAWFLGREASDLPKLQKWKVFGRLNYANLGRSALRGTLMAGITAGVTWASNQVGLGGQMDTPTVITGLTLGKLAADQLAATLGLKTGSESYLNRLFFHKSFVDRAAEIMWFGDKNLPLLTRKAIDRPRASALPEKPARLKDRMAVAALKWADKVNGDDRDRLQALAAFESRCQLLVQGKATEFCRPDLAMEEVWSLVQSINQVKGELYLLMHHNTSRYGKRVITDGASRVTIDNHEVIARLDRMKRNLWYYAAENFGEMALQTLRPHFHMNRRDFEADYCARHKQREILYWGTGGALYTLAFAGVRYFVPLKKATEFARDVLSGEVGLPDKPQLGLGDVEPHWSEAGKYVFDEKDKTKLVAELDTRFDHLQTLDVQLQSHGLFSGAPTDKVWEESLLQNYGLTPPEYEAFVNKLRAANLSVEEVSYMAHALLKSDQAGVLTGFAVGFDQTNSANLQSLVAYFNNPSVDPKAWMQQMSGEAKINPLVFVERPELAAKLGIKVTYEDQANLLQLPAKEKEKLLTSPQPISFIANKVAIKGDSFLVAEFMDGLKAEDRESTDSLLRQMQGLFNADTSALEEALNNPYYLSFLAANNSASPEGEGVRAALFALYGEEDIRDLHSLYARAGQGDPKAFNELMNRLGAGEADLDQVFRQVSADRLTAYEDILGAAQISSENPKQALQNALIHSSTQLGLQPASMRLNVNDFFDASLASSPSLSSQEALVGALNGTVPLESALIAQQTSPSVVFTRGGAVEYVYNETLQSNVASFPLAESLLAIEESPWDNDEITFLERLGYRNIRNQLGLNTSASGASDYAMTMVDWLAGGPGQFTINNQPAFFHRPDEYSLGYLMKLTAAMFTDKVPQDLEASFTSLADHKPLTPEDQEAYNSMLGKMCWKFETYLAAQRLSKIYTPDELAQIYARWVPGGRINGLQIRGWDMMSQVYFGEHFNNLPMHQQHLIFVISQSGDRWSPVNLLPEDYQLYYEHNNITNPPDLDNYPADRLQELNEKVRKFKIETLIERAAGQLEANPTWSRLKTEQPEVWNEWMGELAKIKANPEKYFTNKIPDGYWDEEAFKDPAVNQLFVNYEYVHHKQPIPGKHLIRESGEYIERRLAQTDGLQLNRKAVARLMEQGKAHMSADGQLIIELPSLVQATEQVFPNEVFQATEVDESTQTELFVRAKYQALFGSQIKTHEEGAAFTFDIATEAGPLNGQVAPWVTGTGDSRIVNPGLATIIVDGNQEVLANIDLTGVVTQGPQEFGSAVKPLMVWALSVLEPERFSISKGVAFNNDRFFINNEPVDDFGELWEPLNQAGPLNLGQDIVLSANRPLVSAMHEFLRRNPNDGFEKIQEVLGRIGLKVYFYDDLNKFEDRAPHMFELGVVPIGDKEGADKSGALAFARAYAMIANPEKAFANVTNEAEREKMIREANIVFNYLSDDKNRDNSLAVKVWGPQLLSLLSGKCGADGKSVCASKTGTADLGSIMGVKNVTTITMDTEPDGQVKVFFTLASGHDGEKQINLHQYGMLGGQEALPINRMLTDSIDQGEKVSPTVALNSLDLMFRGINPELPYRLGKISPEFVQSSLNKLLGKDYMQVEKEGGYYLVDLVGEPQHGVQTIALSYDKHDGAGRQLVTLQVPAEIVTELSTGSPDISSASIWDKTFNGSIKGFFSAQREYIGKALLKEEANTEILNKRLIQLEVMEAQMVQLQSHGFNFVPVSAVQNSPLFSTLSASMTKNGFLFAGPEEYGAIMQQMGFDPAHTVFVNQELADLYLNSDHGEMLLYNLLHQQGYFAVSQIYEAAGKGSSLERIMYHDSQVSLSRRLIDLYLDTIYYEANLPIPAERQMLVRKFLALNQNPQAEVLAPDVVRGFQAFKSLYQETITAKAPPDANRAQELVQGMDNFAATTRPEVLKKLEIAPVDTENKLKEFRVKPQTLPTQLLQAAAPPVDQSLADASGVVEAIDVERVMGGLRVSHSGDSLSVSDASRLNTDFALAADAFNKVFAERDEWLLSGKDDAYAQAQVPVRLAEVLQSYGYSVDAKTLKVMNYINAQHCFSSLDALSSLVRILNPNSQVDFKKLGFPGIAEFGENSQTIGNAAGAMGGIKYALGESGVVGGYYKEWLQNPRINDFQAGDLVVLKAPNFDSTGHIGMIVNTGVTETGEPYALFFESNYDNENVGHTRILAFTGKDLLSVLTGYTPEQIAYYQENNIPLPYIGIIRNQDALGASQVASR